MGANNLKTGEQFRKPTDNQPMNVIECQRSHINVWNKLIYSDILYIFSFICKWIFVVFSLCLVKTDMKKRN